MHIHLVAIGKRMPDWMRVGFDEYRKRLPRECTLELKAIDSPVKSASMASEKR
ncbi:MAG: 23S rRNA (pseudouridine(1915)-N(3))-methyltransferase RlmH, partial [Gammaproteobacteria bacterium]